METERGFAVSPDPQRPTNSRFDAVAIPFLLFAMSTYASSTTLFCRTEDHPAAIKYGSVHSHILIRSGWPNAVCSKTLDTVYNDFENAWLGT